MNAIDAIARMLLHSLWIGCATAILLRAAVWIERDRPQRRYIFACLALAMTMVLPATITFLPSLTRSPASRQVAARSAADDSSNAATMSQAQAEASSNGQYSIAPISRLTVVVIWISGVLLFSLYRGAGWFYLHRLRRRARPLVHGDWPFRTKRLAREMSVSRLVLLLESAQVQVPMVVGWIRPVILLPIGALTGLPAAQLDALIMHELAHIRRHDYLINLAQVVIETFLFFHPAVWWISGQIRREREFCCDDAVARRCQDRLLYAQALLRMAELCAAPPTLALAATGGSLTARIQRILIPHSSRSSTLGTSALILALLIGITLPLIATATRAAEKPSTKPASTQPVPSPITPQDLAALHEDYTISENDLITTRIIRDGQPDAVRTARVSPNGLLPIPLLKTPIKAKDITEAKLEETLQAEFKNANLGNVTSVSVKVIEARGATFSILGLVAKPGQYQRINEEMKLSDALKIAGNPRQGAATIQVIRPVPIAKEKPREEPRILEIPLEKLKSDPKKWDINIRPKDTIMVTEKPDK